MTNIEEHLIDCMIKKQLDTTYKDMNINYSVNLDMNSILIKKDVMFNNKIIRNSYLLRENLFLPNKIKRWSVLNLIPGNYLFNIIPEFDSKNEHILQKESCNPNIYLSMGSNIFCGDCPGLTLKGNIYDPQTKRFLSSCDYLKLDMNHKVNISLKSIYNYYELKIAQNDNIVYRITTTVNIDNTKKTETILIGFKNCRIKLEMI